MRARHAYRRILFGTALVLLFVLYYTTEPRRRAYSCKTFWSCIGNQPARYHHPLPVEPQILENEARLRDGTVYFSRQLVADKAPPPDLLFLVLNKDRSSWSKDFRSTGRSIHDFLDLLVSTDLDLSKASLSLMTSSADEFDEVKKATAQLPFARTVVLLKQDDGPKFTYKERHKPSVQLERRAAIAALRNYAMLRSLGDERHIIWLDADVVGLTRGILQTMLKHSEKREEVGLITARCRQHLMQNYDKNAWSVNREAAPVLLGVIGDDDRDNAVAQNVQTRIYADVHVAGTSDEDLIPLDSVGGTLLYIKADLVRQGLTFPTFNIVGTTWNKPGWVGIETEGICYTASHLKGGGCFLLGGSHEVRHADLG